MIVIMIVVVQIRAMTNRTLPHSINERDYPITYYFAVTTVDYPLQNNLQSTVTGS